MEEVSRPAWKIAQQIEEVSRPARKLVEQMEEANRPARELAEQMTKLNRQKLLEVERLGELARQAQQTSLSEIMRRNGIEHDHLSKLAEIARSQTRASRDLVENVRRLPMPPSLVHSVETYQRDVEESLHQVEELQELETGSGEGEDASDEAAVRMLQQSEIQTELAHRQVEVFMSMLRVLEAQLEESREGERSANVKWWWATGVAAAGLVATVLSLIVALG